MLRRNQPLDRVNVVEIVPVLRKAGQTPQLVVVCQYRPPVDAYTLELPAGLVEENVEDAAIRELYVC